VADANKKDDMYADRSISTGNNVVDGLQFFNRIEISLQNKTNADDRPNIDNVFTTTDV